MCGRSSLSLNETELEALFPNVTFKHEDLERYNPLPLFNVAPSMVLPVILDRDPGHFSPLRWGLVPAWSPSPKVAFSNINARIETVFQKPAYRQAIRERRCLVPATGYYEFWEAPNKQRIPYHFTLKDRPVFCFAGIWETWKDAEGYPRHTFAILTQPPNAFVEKIHDRMPVILSAENQEAWLESDLNENQLREICSPTPAEAFQVKTVHTKANNVRNQGPEILQEVQYPQQSGLGF